MARLSETGVHVLEKTDILGRVVIGKVDEFGTVLLNRSVNLTAECMVCDTAGLDKAVSAGILDVIQFLHPANMGVTLIADKIDVVSMSDISSRAMVTLYNLYDTVALAMTNPVPFVSAVLSDIVNLGEALYGSPTVNLSDVVQIVHGEPSHELERVFTEVINIIGAYIINPGKDFLEAITLADTFTIPTVTTHKTEQLIIDGIVNSIHSYSLPTDVVNMYAAFKSMPSRIMTLEVINTSMTFAANPIHTLVLDILSAADVISKRPTYYKTEKLDIKDFINSIHSKVLTEVINLIPTVIPSLTLFLTDLVYVYHQADKPSSSVWTYRSCVVMFYDAVSQGGMVHGLYEALLVIGSLPVEATTTLTTDALSLSDVIAQSVLRDLELEVINIIDSVTSSPLAYLVDSIHLVDPLAIPSPVKYLTEVIDLLISLPANATASLADSIVVSGTYSNIALTTLPSEVVTLTGYLSKAVSVPKVDTINIIGAKSNIVLAHKTDGLTLADSITKSFGRVLTDVMAMGDILGYGPVKFVSEVIRLIDPLTQAQGISKTLSEVLRVIDTMTWQFTNQLFEVISFGDTMGNRTIVTHRFDIVQMAKDTIPIGPFEYGRVNVIIQYNSLPIHVVQILETLKKNPLTKMVLETINLATADFDILCTHIMVCFLTIRSNDVPRLKVEIARGFTDSFTIADLPHIARVGKVFDEVITLAGSIIYPLVTELFEVIRLLDTMPHRITSYGIPLSLILGESRTSAVHVSLPEEVLNVISQLNPSEIRAYLREYLVLRAPFHTDITFVKDEVLRVIDVAVHTNANVSLTAEILRVIDDRSVSIAKPIIETLKLIESKTNSILSYKTEVINLVDDVYSQFGILLIETIQFADSLLKHPAPYMIEKLYFLDDLISTYGMILTEVIAVGDSFISWPQKVFNETIELTQVFNTNVDIIKLETIRLFQTVTKRPMRYQEIESITVSDAYSASVLSILVAEALTISDTVDRMVSVQLIEIVKLTDVKCAKLVSFVTHETLVMIDWCNTALSQTLLETISLSDSKYLSVLSTKLEALLVVGRIAKGVQKYPFAEVITVVDTANSFIMRILTEVIEVIGNLGPTSIQYTAFREAITLRTGKLQKVINYSAFSESILLGEGIIKSAIINKLEELVLNEDMTKHAVVSRAFTEVIMLTQTTKKIVHDYVLSLETITVSDLGISWYNNLVHRLDSVAKSSLSRYKERTGKESVIKKITKDSKRE